MEETTNEKRTEAEQTTPAGLEVPDADFADPDPGHGEYVGIKAHIKEVKGDWALISSDTDGPLYHLLEGITIKIRHKKS